MDNNTRHEYVIQESVSGTWFERKTRFDSYDGARYGVLDLGVEFDPAYRIARVTTIIEPVGEISETTPCKCGHSYGKHCTDGGPCSVEIDVEHDEDTGNDYGGYADDCMAFVPVEQP